MTTESARHRVLNSLAYGHARGVNDVVERLAKAGVKGDRGEVETGLLELVEAGLVEPVGSGWRRR